jgi:tetratricopeptide (TPR) repeat protein
VTAVQAKRLIGLGGGTALLLLGAAGMVLSKANYENAGVRRFCDVWLCPEEFTPERVFALSQQAALGNAQGQLRDFQRALLADSASAYRWADLADSEFNVNDLAKAKYAYEQALKAGPRSPVILFRAANFDFETGDYPRAVNNLSQILRDPNLAGYYDTVFLTYSRLGMPVSQLLATGLPKNAVAGTRFLQFWINAGKTAEAKETWEWLAGNHLLDDDTAGAYVDFLISKKALSLAQQTWREYTQREMPQFCQTNWIYNGDLEQAFKPSPFDWKMVASSEVDAGRVDSQASHGRWSLQLNFHASSNIDYRQTYQSLVLTPGKWRFSARVKLQNVTTDQGIGFHVVDFQTPANLDVRTDPENGSADWHTVTRDFTVLKGTGLIRIEIARQQSLRFDNKITGTAWVDELTMIPVGRN